MDAYYLTVFADGNDWLARKDGNRIDCKTC